MIPIFRTLYRLFKYSGERNQFISSLKTQWEQNKLLRRYSPRTDKLVLFIVPGKDRASGEENISGGVMSVVSISEHTKELRHVHQSETFLCTIPGDFLILNFKLFVNKSTVFRLEQLADRFKHVTSVIVHVPEFMTEQFERVVLPKFTNWFRMGFFHVNIMNQNILLMPGADVMQRLKSVANRVTITTAHRRYSSAFYRKKFDIPLHELSVWIDPRDYNRATFDAKDDMIVVSPDPNPGKERILEKLRSVAGLEVVVIKGLTYEQYKALIARAKWTLTFGEGLDGYIIEPVFSGAIGFAVYNEDFFPEDFEDAEGIFKTYDELAESIADKIKKWDNAEAFRGVQQSQFELCSKYYNGATYRKNIESFYREEYTFA